jgi:GntR family transcriptional repressor for pyruvate dehydrogenase complex
MGISDVSTGSQRAANDRRTAVDLPSLPRGRVSERVVEEIRSYIAQNGLRPGHKLPPERVFIDRLNVGRSSLREALRVLTTLGVIEVRHGDGMYVAAAPDPSAGSPAAIFDATEQNALRNLVETRLGIELAAAIAATQRATDEDLEQLERFLDEQERRLRDDPDYTWEPLAFELAVVEITGNTWLHDVEVMLRDAWLSLSEGLRSTVGRHREWLTEHRAILASMRSRNVAQVQRLVIAHVSLQRFEDDMRSLSAGRSGRRPRAGRTATGRTRT